jgi:hypothetical protein
MITTAMKLVSVVALLLAACFWTFSPSFELVLRVVVCAGAYMVARQASHGAQHYWVAGFYLIAVLFNPFLRLFTPTGTMSLYLVLVTATSFAISLYVLKRQPLLSIPSITDRTPGSESL